MSWAGRLSSSSVNFARDLTRRGCCVLMQPTRDTHSCATVERLIQRRPPPLMSWTACSRRSCCRSAPPAHCPPARAGRKGRFGSQLCTHSCARGDSGRDGSEHHRHACLHESCSFNNDPGCMEGRRLVRGTGRRGHFLFHWLPVSCCEEMTQRCIWLAM